MSAKPPKHYLEPQNKADKVRAARQREQRKTEAEQLLYGRNELEVTGPPEQPQVAVLQRRAKALEVEGDYEEAARTYEQILRVDPVNVEIKRALACVNTKINAQLAQSRKSQRAADAISRKTVGPVENYWYGPSPPEAPKPPSAKTRQNPVPPDQYLKELKQQAADKQRRETAAVVAAKKEDQLYAAKLHLDLQLERQAAVEAAAAQKLAMHQLGLEDREQARLAKQAKNDAWAAERSWARPGGGGGDVGASSSALMMPGAGPPPDRRRTSGNSRRPSSAPCPFARPSVDQHVDKIRPSDVKARMNAYIEKRTKKPEVGTWV